MARGLWCLATAGVLAISLASPVGAQQTTRATFGVGGGVTIPTGDFGDGFKTGWHGLVNVGFRFPIAIGLRIDGYYGENNLDDGGVVDGKAKLLGGLAGATYEFRMATGRVTPYVIGNVGYFNQKFDSDLGDSDESDFAVGGGGGINFGLGSINAFVEGRYLTILSEGPNTDFVPITVGVRFGGGI